MNAVLRAEVRKLRATRSLLAVPAAGLAVATFGTAALMATAKPDELASRLSDHGPLRFGPTNLGLLLVVLGVRLFADEVQHRTLAATLVRTPDRATLVLAKVVVAAATAVALCAAAYAVTIGVTVAGAALRDLPMAYDVGATAALFGRVTLAMVLLAGFGVGVGAAAANRTVALVGVLVWFALAEDLVGALLRIERFLPGAAVQGLVAADPGQPTSAALGVALLGGFAVAAVGAAVTSLRRDVA